MKILILGTSNSILRAGWVHGLRAAAPKEMRITNASVGASPGSQFISWCGPDRDLSEFDCVVFDSVPNDENLADYVGDRAFYARLLHQIFATIAAQTRLVVLGFCNKRFAHKRSYFYGLHESLCAQVGGNFISVIDYALARPGASFLDGPHIHPDHAHAFGANFPALLEKLTAPSRRTPSYAQNFLTLEMSTLCDAPQVVKRNSLFSDCFSRLSPGTEVDFGTCRRLMGMSIDVTATYGFLKMTCGQERRCKALRYNMAASGFLAKFVPLRGGFETAGFRVLAEADDCEDSPHERDPVPLAKRAVSISRLSFWSGAEKA